MRTHIVAAVAAASLTAAAAFAAEPADTGYDPRTGGFARLRAAH